ncbi:MAG: energy-coupled thiamine transporter ThiT [Oscillospiraceae bacterium]|nr:energy-coupled thiamine transporter ThiT [Oscillospiraceae bacterium]
MENSLKSRESVRALTESAILIALGYILSFLVLFRMPQGGSVTPFSMLPVMVIGIRHGLKWGLGSGFVFACLQMLRNFWPPPTGTLEGYIAVIMLDYLLAYSVLGMAGLFKGKQYGLLFAVPLCLLLRFFSHFLSGVIVWNIYAGDQPVWLYSLVYNGSFMGVELVITMAVSALLCTAAPVLFIVQKSQKPIMQGAEVNGGNIDVESKPDSTVDDIKPESTVENNNPENTAEDD